MVEVTTVGTCEPWFVHARGVQRGSGPVRHIVSKSGGRGGLTYVCCLLNGVVVIARWMLSWLLLNIVRQTIFDTVEQIDFFERLRAGAAPFICFADTSATRPPR